MACIVLERKKFYPVGNWERYQHVFYNANDRAFNALCDAQDNGNEAEIEKAEEWRNTVEDMLTKWDFNPKVNGIVYALYEDYKIMKDIIGGYAARHGGYV